MWRIFFGILLVLFEVGGTYSFRLPNDTKPEAYFITLEFGNIESGMSEFLGEIFIKISILKDTNQITIHSAVNITGIPFICKYPSSNCPDALSVNTSYKAEQEFLHISIENDTLLRQDEIYYLNLQYTGSIYSSVTGVYLGNYFAQNGDENFFLATHMQPTHARKVFPCYDEPKFKAKYHLTLIHSDQYRSITNMDIESELLRLNQKIRVFKPTSLLPTYLIAFVISKFEYLSKIHNGIEFRGFARDGQVQNTEFGIDTAIEALDKFNAALNLTNNGMTKLDQVALPLFNYGGMENDQIFFYREDFLLYEERINTAYDKEYVAQTVVHEVCHKYFGNLLTPNWWSILWISEGFCKFYEYYMVKPIYPEMRTDEMFLVETLQNVMIRDASPHIRPMTYYVEKPADVRGLFDSIAYSKSACVLRMFMYAFTPQVFNKGLHIYLTNNTNNTEGISEPENLYAAFQKALPESTDINVLSVMQTWELQSGFPYIDVKRAYFTNVTRFTQMRFMNDNQTDNSLWHIPITYSTNRDNFTKINQFWTNARTIEDEFDLRPKDILIVNINQQGYFRVHYDKANWMSIAKFLYNEDYEKISPTTRAMLIDDAAVFAGDGKLDMKLFLEVLKYLERDDDWIPWYTATENIIYMRRMLDDGSSELYQNFRKFLRKLLTKVYKTYGSEVKSGEPHHHKHIRNIAINWACQAYLEECLNDTKILMNKAIKDDSFNELPNDHRSAIMCNGVLQADLSVYESLYEFYSSPTKNNSEKIQILQTIGCIENESILKSFIEKYDKVSLSHFLTVIQAVYANGPIGLRVAMTFLRAQQEKFYNFIISNNRQSSLNSIFTGISNRVNTKELFEEYIKLIELYKIPEATNRTAVATMTANLNWITKHNSSIIDFLENYLNASGKLMIMWPLVVGALIIKSVF